MYLIYRLQHTIHHTEITYTTNTEVSPSYNIKPSVHKVVSTQGYGKRCFNAGQLSIDGRLYDNNIVYPVLLSP